MFNFYNVAITKYQIHLYTVMFCCTETPIYFPMDVIAGNSVELKCNASLTSGVMWTYDNDDPYVQYVYWNGHIHKPRLSVKTIGGNIHSLLISDVQLTDSGLYSCYDGEGLRKVGYQLIVNGMHLYISKICLTCFTLQYNTSTVLAVTRFHLSL